MNLDTILNELGPKFEKSSPIFDRENHFAGENFLELKERGVYKALIPKELGGGGVEYFQLCYFIKNMAKRCPSTALTLSMHQHLLSVLTYKHLHGDKDATDTLELIAKEDLILLSTGGGDWISSNGEAEKVEGGYKINCKKAFCSGAPIADVAVMSCAYQDGEKENVLHFSVPLRSEGIEMIDDWDAMGMRSTGSNTINFKNVFIPEKKVSLIREKGKWHPLWDMVSTFAFPVFIAPYAGIAEAITEKTIDLFSNGPLKDRASVACLGEMNNRYQITKWAFDDLVGNARNFDVIPSNATAIRALQDKSLITRNGRGCAQMAMEALGGYSYYRSTGIEKLYRDLLAGEFHPLQEVKLDEVMGNYLANGSIL